MNLEFGNFEVVERTFTRKDAKPRGQDYDGIKFRRSVSKKAGVTDISEVFIVSNTAWEKLNLDNFALTQANTPAGVVLMVVEDQDEKKPVAKMFRKSVKKNGETLQKGKMISNEFLLNDLIKAGLIKPEVHGNQFLAITDVTSTVKGLPEVVQSVWLLSEDTSVDAEASNKEDEEAETEVKKEEF